MEHLKFFVKLVGLSVLLVACTAPIATNAPTAIPPSPSPIPPTATPVPPTHTPVSPTDTPEPTDTPVPTETPEPVRVVALEEMIGDWRRTKPSIFGGGDIVIRIDAEGRLFWEGFNKDWESALASLNRGKYHHAVHIRFDENDLLVFYDSSECPGLGYYKVYRAANGNLLIKTDDDSCQSRTASAPGEWIRIE